jgi:hypothetical protein
MSARRRAPLPEFAALDAPAHVLDLVPRERVPVDHHLEAVVIRGIVAAGHRDAAAAAQMVRGEVGDRRRRHADVDHGGAGSVHALRQRFGQRGARVPAITAERELRRHRTQRAADGTHHFRRERAPGNAADVVGAEDFGGQVHGAEKYSSSRRASQRPRPGKPA